MTLLAIFEALVGANAIWETTVDEVTRGPGKGSQTCQIKDNIY